MLCRSSNSGFAVVDRQGLQVKFPTASLVISLKFDSFQRSSTASINEAQLLVPALAKLISALICFSNLCLNQFWDVWHNLICTQTTQANMILQSEVIFPASLSSTILSFQPETKGFLSQLQDGPAAIKSLCNSETDTWSSGLLFPVFLGGITWVRNWHCVTFEW